MITDFSFLRLKPSFALANELFDPKITTHNYHNIIALSPTEKYLQISNLSTGLAFDEDYTVELIDICENVLEDITDRVFISEFISRDGVNQISFEIAPIITDYYEKELFFKITHTTGSDIYYSNPFLVTDNKIEQSTRFDYKAYGYFKGIEYDRADFYQSIRLRCYYDRPSDETEIKDYYQITRGKNISTRALLEEKEIYKFEYVNPFVFRAVNVLLIHDIIYIDGVRMTNKTTVKSDERLADSNLMESEFTVCKDYDDTYTAEYQIYAELSVVKRVVENGSYGNGGFAILTGNGENLSLVFNKTIEITNDITATIYKDGVLFYVVPAADISVIGIPTLNTVTFDVSPNPITDKANYIVVVEPNKVFHDFDFWQGFAYGEWNFNIIDGDFLISDWNSNDFLIY